MKARVLTIVPALVGISAPILLCILVYYMVFAPPSLRFFINRWVSSPAYSPDAERIAFACHYPTWSQLWEDKGRFLLSWGYIDQATEICTARLDGSQFTRLLHNSASDDFPAWSPDGQRIAYLSELPYTPGVEWERAIYVVEKDGTRPMKLSAGFQLQLEKPVWAPSGQELYFSGEDRLAVAGSGYNLYAVNVEDGELRALTSLPGDEVGAQWSPEGSRLAYLWFPRGFRWEMSESAAIRIMDETGRDQVVVEDFVNIGHLSWSPDGKRLAFWATLPGDCPAGTCAEVFVIDPADTTIECLTGKYELGRIDQIAWSPDGERIAFVAQTGRGAVDAYTGKPDHEVMGPAVFAIEPASGKLLRVSESGIPYPANLTWAPDAKSIAFNSGFEGDKSHIWFLEMKDGRLRRLRVP